MRWGLIQKSNDSNSGLDLFRNEVNNLFDDFFSVRTSSLFENEWIPSVDVQEGSDLITVRADMPGLSEKNIEVSLEKNILIISGEKKEEKSEENKKDRYLVSERRFGSFRRSIHLPGNIVQDRITADFKNGVLTIQIPKDENVKTRKIEIRPNDRRDI